MVFLGFMIFSLALVMVVYLLRHYVFTAIVLCFGRSSDNVLEGDSKPVVSVVIPARNEERVVGRLLRRITEFTYPKEKLRVVVVEDGSTDGTGKIIDEFARQYSFIKVLHRERSEAAGKPAALNEALKHVMGDFVYFFDADYVPERNILEKLNSAFSDPKVGAVQGRIKVLNEGKLVSRVASLERVGSYRVDQLARDILELIPQFGGTVGGVRRSLLRSLGGFDANVLAEDTDLTFRVYLAGFKIRYVLNAESYEEAVVGWRGYWRQRYRWSRGHMQCAFKHLWPLLKSKNLTLREKLDGFLLLNVYFVPVLVGFGWLFAVVSFLLGYGLWAGRTALLVTLIYFASGNIAPLSEVIVGAILDKRGRLCRYLPFMLFAFFLNVLICTKAIIDLLISKICGKPSAKWDKTVHKGWSQTGNNY